MVEGKNGVALIMIFIVILLSCIIAFGLRIFDVLVVFAENNIYLNLKESFQVFWMLNRNFFDLIKKDYFKKEWSSIKFLFKSYTFHYRLLLVLLSSLTYEIIRVKGIKFSSKTKNNSILTIIKDAFPAFNERQRDISFA